MFLFLLTKAIAFASTVHPTPRGVAGAVQTAARDRQVLRFFSHHPWLLKDPRFRDEARHQITVHRRSLAAAQRVIARAHLPSTYALVGAATRAADDRKVLRFFSEHAWLLRDARFGPEAERQVQVHRRSLASAVRVLRRAHFRVDVRRGASRSLAQASHELPAVTVCRVFGRYCDQALHVVSCESGFRTVAQNGQYLGLFQMGTTARQRFGHGSSAETQARAAHRYFVASGRDWSPWSCRPR